MKIVINTKPGGYRIPPKLMEAYCKLKGVPCHFFISGPGAPSTVDEYIPATPEEIGDYWYITATVPVLDFSAWCEDNIIRHIPRTDPHLVAAVEQFPDLAESWVCKLKVVDIPDDVEYTIEHDSTGTEWIAEKHRTWE